MDTLTTQPTVSQIPKTQEQWRVIEGLDGKQYKLTPKFKEWFRLDTTPGQECFGNHTKAAAVAYGYDLKDPVGYNNARKMGYQNYTKLHNLASVYLDKSDRYPLKYTHIL